MSPGLNGVQGGLAGVQVSVSVRSYKVLHGGVQSTTKDDTDLDDHLGSSSVLGHNAAVVTIWPALARQHQIESRTVVSLRLHPPRSSRDLLILGQLIAAVWVRLQTKVVVYSPDGRLADREGRPYGSRCYGSSAVGQQVEIDSEARSILEICRSAHLVVRPRPDRVGRAPPSKTARPIQRIAQRRIR